MRSLEDMHICVHSFTIKLKKENNEWSTLNLLLGIYYDINKSIASNSIKVNDYN